MKRLIGVLMAALFLIAPASVLAVTPTHVPTTQLQNPTCADLYPDVEGLVEFKIETPEDQEDPSSQTDGDGTLSVSIVVPSATGTSPHSFDWTSNIEVLGVIVKDGTDGSNWYDYSPDGSTGDNNLTTPVDGRRGISHISFCYVPGEVDEADALTVIKDAAGSYDTTYDWDIDKSADDDEIFTAGGADGSMDFKVTVSHDGGTIGSVKVSGTITVTNPNSANVALDSVHDWLSIDPETFCSVDTSSTPGLVLPPGDSDYPYECELDELPDGSVTNHVEIAWSEQTLSDDTHLDAGSAEWDIEDIDFTGTDIDECITVDDTNPAGPQDEEVCAADAPKDFEYTGTISGDAGTCTDNDNTASFDANDTEQSGEASWTVTDCQGADLIVTKTANPAFERAYDWDIDKRVDATSIETQPGGTATFNYTVDVSHGEGSDGNWTVTGTITIENPNDWQDITLTDLDDEVDNGGVCALDSDGPYVVPMATYDDDDNLVNGVLEVDYTCTYASEPTGDGTNTATATWDADAAHTPNGSDSGTAAVAFSTTEPALIDECINVVDPLEDIDETFCVGDDDEVDNGFTIEYSHDVAAPALGECVEVDNTATYTTVDDDNDTDETDSDSVTVEVCTFNAALTQGYWRNHLAPIGNGCKSKDGCSANGPWTVDYLGDEICDGCLVGELGNYTVDTKGEAKAVFDANNCGSASSSNKNAAACLAAQLLAAELNVANVANDCICDTIAEAIDALAAVGYNGPGSSVNLSGSGYTRADLIELKTALDNYNNGLGCPE